MFNITGLSAMPGTVFINVWNCQAAVSRYVAVTGGIAAEVATNWEALEGAAIVAVAEAGGAVNLSGHYGCPAELAALAEFSEP